MKSILIWLMLQLTKRDSDILGIKIRYFSVRDVLALGPCDDGIYRSMRFIDTQHLINTSSKMSLYSLVIRNKNNLAFINDVNYMVSRCFAEKLNQLYHKIPNKEYYVFCRVTYTKAQKFFRNPTSNTFNDLIDVDNRLDAAIMGVSNKRG